MKKFVLGFISGGIAVIGLVLLMMLSGTPTITTKYKVAQVGPDQVFQSPFFSVVFREVERTTAGSGAFTIAGRDGSIPAFWRGHGEGWSGDERGVSCLRRYNRRTGQATLYVVGHLLLIDQEGTRLQVGNKYVNLSGPPPVIIVETNGEATVTSLPLVQVLRPNGDEIRAQWVSSDTDYGSAAPAVLIDSPRRLPASTP